MREEDEIHVNNIISCINEIENYVDGMTYEEFRDEDDVKESVTSNLEEIGEAVSMLSEDFVSQFSDVDYKLFKQLKKAGFEDRIEDDPKGVWNIATSGLSGFKDMLSGASGLADDDDDDFAGDFSDDDEFNSGKSGYKRSGKFSDDDDDDFEIEDDFNFDEDEDLDDLYGEDDRF